jgi:hypothetical protein
VSRLRGRAVQRTSHDSQEFGAFCFGRKSVMKTDKAMVTQKREGDQRYRDISPLSHSMLLTAVVLFRLVGLRVYSEGWPRTTTGAFLLARAKVSA